MSKPSINLLTHRGRADDRHGVIIVLTGFLLVIIFAFMALAVDSGRIVLTETQMQNAVDAAALAASQEIAAAVYEAGQGGGAPGVDPNSIAAEAARDMAAQVAAANGVYIDPAIDVSFGKRTYDTTTNTWPITWGGSPVNVVRVTARKTNSDSGAPDAKLPLAFGWAIGRESVPIQSGATAFVEARDMVLVLDFSASMNDDSSLNSSLSMDQVEAALDNMWQEVRDSDVRWPNKPNRKKWRNRFGEIRTAEGTYISSSSTNTIFNTLNLDETNNNGVLKWPFPQSGRASDDTPNNMPSASTSENLWKDYIDYTKNLSGPYQKKYGRRTLMSYLQNSRPRTYQSEDLWRTSHYPYHAVKEGASLFLNFLTDLDFGDEVGLVSYGAWAEWEDRHDDGEVSIDLSADPISPDYAAIDTIQRRHQAGHYSLTTGMGDGILKGREMLVGSATDPSDDGHTRYGARPTLIVMTDGRANVKKSGWSLPGGFDWANWTDYDDDGTADYSTSDSNKEYAFWEATEAIKLGITVHTMAVGQNADRNLMRAIAFAGNGIFINVPGGANIADLESQMLDAFGQIAAKVPPAKLVFNLEAE